MPPFRRPIRVVSKDFAKLKTLAKHPRARGRPCRGEPRLRRRHRGAASGRCRRAAHRGASRPRDLRATRRRAERCPTSTLRSRASDPTASRRSSSPRARPGSPKGVVNTQRMLCSNQQAIAHDVALPRGPSAGRGRLAAVEPHVRRQSQLLHGALARRHALHRRGQARAGRVRRDARGTCARSRRPCISTSRAASTCSSRSSKRTTSSRATFFRDLDVVFYAAAALSQPTWERLEAVSSEDARRARSRWSRRGARPRRRRS